MSIDNWPIGVLISKAGPHYPSHTIAFPITNDQLEAFMYGHTAQLYAEDKDWNLSPTGSKRAIIAQMRCALNSAGVLVLVPIPDQSISPLPAGCVSYVEDCA